MKIRLLFYLCFIFMNVSSQNIYKYKDRIYEMSVNDSAIIRLNYNLSNKLESITNYKKIDDSLLLDGYQYYFYENGRMKEITFYYFGKRRDFLFVQNIHGGVDTFISSDGQDILEARNEVFQTSVIDYFCTGDTLGYGFKYTFSKPKLDLLSVEGLGGLDCIKNGLYIYISENKVRTIENYECNELFGACLYFNKKGKIKIFQVYRENDSNAVLIKKLPKVL